MEPTETILPGSAPNAAEVGTAHREEPIGSPEQPTIHAPGAPPHKSGWRRIVGVILCVLVVACLLAMGIAPRLRQDKSLAVSAADVKNGVVLVNVANPHAAPGTTDIVLPGNIQAIDETIINARTSGYLVHRYVDIGSRVTAGELLADIEAPEVDQQLLEAHAETSKTQAGNEQAQADVARMRANVVQAGADLARMKSNTESARADQVHAQAKVLEAQSAASEARAKLDQVQKKVLGQKAELARAKSRSALAQITLGRWQKLAKGGAISGQDLDVAQTDYDTSLANVTAAQADLDSAYADVNAATAALESRQQDIAAAQADVSAARQKVNAAQSAVDSGRANVTAMEASVSASQASVRAAQSGVAASRANENRFTAMRGFEHVVAPFAGVITSRNVDTGALINAGSALTASDPTSTLPRTGLFGIAKTDYLRAQVDVPEMDAGQIAPGLEAQVLPQAYPNRVFPGRVLDTGGALDASSRTLLAEVRVKNVDNLLKPGMYAEIRFVTHRAHPALRIPANTVMIDAKGTRVVTVTAEHKLHFVTVKIRHDLGSEFEISSGLNSDDQLVTNPTDALSEGETVRVVEAGK